MSLLQWIEVIFLVALIIAAGSILLYSFRFGISPMPSSRRAVAAMLSAVPSEPAEIVDLGAGWGTLLAAATEAFPEARIRAFEVSPIPYAFSRLRLLLSGSTAVINRQDFRTALLPKRGVIFCYLFPEGMTWVQDLLNRSEFEELWLISHTFALPNATPERVQRLDDPYQSPIYLYCFRSRDLK